jgi:hypothetical protein
VHKGENNYDDDDDDDNNNNNNKYPSNIPEKREIKEQKKKPYWALHTNCGKC